MPKEFSFYLVTDTHYFDSSFSASGPAYERRSRTDQKCVAETPYIIDAGFEKIAADKETEVILIPGDLVYRGERKSHIGFRDRLYKLKEQGKRIYITTARHDYCGYGDKPVEFIGEQEVPVEGMERSELREFYKDFGFGEAISEHAETMSYTVQLTDGIRLMALNCDGDLKKFKGLSESQLSWIKEQIAKAHNSGNYIFAMVHYPLLPFSPVMSFIEDARLTDWEKTADFLADCGLNLIFTGHMHAQAVTEHKSKNGNIITDVQTGSFVGCPCSYRKVTFLESGQVDIKSYTVEDFDWDKQGKTAEEYFRWRFDRMITDMVDAMAYDFAFFTRLFGGPEKNKKLKIPITAAGKILQKLTVGGLGRVLLVKPSEKIKNVLVKDAAVTLVRNVFIGNEPYYEGTPEYETMEKFLKRLKPVLSIIEKKAGKSNPQLCDIGSLVLSTIGDKAQRDYFAVLDAEWNKYN